MESEACKTLIGEFETDIRSALRKSKRGFHFNQHGFTIWEDNGDYKKSDLISKNIDINLPRKLNKNNVIFIKTREFSSPHFHPEDIIQLNPFPDSSRGSVKAVCIFIDAGSNGVLKCAERTNVCTDIKKQFELIDKNEEFEQLYNEGHISKNEAVLSMIDNLGDYIDIYQTSIPIGKFSISI